MCSYNFMSKSECALLHTSKSWLAVFLSIIPDVRQKLLLFLVNAQSDFQAPPTLSGVSMVTNSTYRLNTSARLRLMQSTAGCPYALVHSSQSTYYMKCILYALPANAYIYDPLKTRTKLPEKEKNLSTTTNTTHTSSSEGYVCLVTCCYISISCNTRNKQENVMRN